MAHLQSRAKHSAVLLTAVLCVAGTATAGNLSALDDPSLGAKTRYDRCLELARRSPATAIDQAAGWYREGGGAAALHCSALALTDLKRYADAAAKLEAAALEKGLSTAMRGELLDQAGNAWLLAQQADKADAALSKALSFTPQDEDVLTDRARARGLEKDWPGAEADLSAVLSLDPNRADALVLRASARQAQGRRLDALADIDQALQVDPGYPEAILERGTMKFEAGDLAGARADWLQVVSDAPGTDASNEAAARLKELAAAKH
jgi:tetratricopeptide (TPR) repeat protein